MTFKQPEYLTTNDEPNLRLRCPIHGFLRFSRNERTLIDHEIYQRLRYIRQLALTELVYPGATHTRFEHSLGVMHVATLAFDRLASRAGEKLEGTFKKVAEIADRPMAKARQALRLAALLHDLGHTCFSHAAEDQIHKDVGGHEALTQKVLSGEFGGDFHEAIEKAFWPGCSALVSRLLTGPKGNLEPQLLVLHDIVSGVMDADRTDYLRRDAHHCGVDYGRFDHLRLLDSLELHEVEGRLEMAIHRDGIHALEALIIARYQMSTQVYYHRLRRLFDLYLQEYFKALGPEFFATPDMVLRANDVTMLAQIQNDAQNATGARQRWAWRISHRQFHRVIFFTGDHADAINARRAAQLFQHLQNRFDGVEFLIDKPKKPITIHSLAKPGDTDDAAPVLYLVRSSGAAVPVTQESQILQDIPKVFQGVRIFADVPPEQHERRRELQQHAINEWRNLGGQ